MIWSFRTCAANAHQNELGNLSYSRRVLHARLPSTVLTSIFLHTLAPCSPPHGIVLIHFAESAKVRLIGAISMELENIYVFIVFCVIFHFFFSRAFGSLSPFADVVQTTAADPAEPDPDKIGVERGKCDAKRQLSAQARTNKVFYYCYWQAIQTNARANQFGATVQRSLRCALAARPPGTATGENASEVTLNQRVHYI